MWVNQDTVGRNSRFLMQNGDGDIECDQWFEIMLNTSRDMVTAEDLDPDYTSWWKIVEMRLSEKTTAFINLFYSVGLRLREIAISEGLTSQAADQRHIQAKRVVARKLKAEESWRDRIADMVSVRSIRDYDMIRMYFERGFTRKLITKISGIYIGTVNRVIDKQIRLLT